MDDFSVDFNRCCANSTVEIWVLSWGSGSYKGIHGQDDFNVFCGVCGVLTSVDDGLLRHLLPAIQFCRIFPQHDTYILSLDSENRCQNGCIGSTMGLILFFVDSGAGFEFQFYHHHHQRWWTGSREGSEKNEANTSFLSDQTNPPQEHM